MQLSSNAWPYFTEGHSAAQRLYLMWKAEIFKPFRPRVAEAKASDTRRGQWYMTTSRQPAFAEYRQAFYPEGTKIVPAMAYERLGPLGIAVWMMDDGSVNHEGRYSVLCTDCWPLDVQQRLCAWFAERWGLHPVVQFHKKSGSFLVPPRSAYRLRFRVDDTTALIRIIEPHVFPLFRAKWRIDDPDRWVPAMTRAEVAVVSNARRTALIKAGVLRVGYHTGTIRVTTDQRSP